MHGLLHVTGNSQRSAFLLAVEFRFLYLLLSYTTEEHFQRPFRLHHQTIMASSDLDTLIDMGFEKPRAELAVKKTGGCKSSIRFILANSMRV